MKATLHVNLDRVIDQIDERLYSSFIEHMGRAIYHGIYEPEHPTADAEGFRQDVIDLIKPLNIPLIRYPGGNFVSGYEWEDGVGPVRKPVLDAAWGQLEPNTVGTDEFHRWAEKAHAGVMMAVNLGTKEAIDAMHLLEYCNFPAGSKYADMRVENGHREPYGDQVWCLGNEMDGIWQVGHRTARDYADVARKTACLMKMVDPSIELVACGSSSYQMKTFGEWENTVLEQVYQQVEYISLHQYYTNEGKSTAEFLGCANEMDHFIDTVTSICDAIGGAKRAEKKINLSFDEWNVWPKKKSDNQVGRWTIGPRREEYVFTMEDALVFGTLLITLMRHADRVKIACLAQLVNVCAPIMTENMGPAWAQTIYYPFLHASQYGRGISLCTEMDCPYYTAGRHGDVPYVASTAVWNDSKREMTIFAVNRSLTEDAELTLDSKNEMSLIEHIVMDSPQLEDANTLDQPLCVVPHVIRHENSILLPKASWNVLRFQVQ